MKLKLLNSKKLGSGNVLLSYQPVEAKQGINFYKLQYPEHESGL